MQDVPPRFVVGIDLGTTNSAVAYVDLQDGSGAARTPGVRLFEVPQLVAPGEVQRLETLPSFVYFEDVKGRQGRRPHDTDQEGRQERRPHDTDQDHRQGPHYTDEGERAYRVGVFAREQGALVPTRQISSAKSWLSHPAVDRTARILPWAADEPLMSPVDASAAILRHIRESWNTAFGSGAGVPEDRRGAGVAEDRSGAGVPENRSGAGVPENRSGAGVPAGRSRTSFRHAYPLEHQDVVITVPASFDPEARELTLQAARDAGLERVTLLEEPLAAFYAWISSHPRALRTRRGTPPAFKDGELVLVCDVGGGTSDFTLIRVRVRDGAVSFERTAVGEHLLLGGDNLDLALARRLEAKLGDRALTLVQRLALRRSASAAKERLLSDPSCERLSIAILGSGRSLVGGSLSTELTRDEVTEALTGGFLPIVDAGARPARDRRTALRELGLPYAEDAAISRHLAAFLADAAAAAAEAAPAAGVPSNVVGPASVPATMERPEAILFNGGFFTPAVARERIVQNLAHWFSPGGGWRPEVLENQSPAAAVALGAAYYALVRRRGGLRVRAGSARAYYIGVDAGAHAAVCILPRGTEEGTTFDLSDREFAVMTNKPVSFPLFSNAIRRDPLGTMSSGDLPGMHAHAPLTTVLRYGKKSRQVELAVHLSSAFTETGTLEVSCGSRSSEHRWKLHFRLRGEQEEPTRSGRAPETDMRPDRMSGNGDAAAEPEAESVIGPDRLAAAQEAIGAVFGGVNMAGTEAGPTTETAGTEAGPTAETAGATASPTTPEALPGQLEATLGFGRQAWPLPVIRTLADSLLAVAGGRKKGPRFEARWLNLLGFCLRPGFGAPLDDWRVGQTRGLYQEGLAFAKDLQCQVEWIVLWQRIAGGLKAGQQRELYQRHATVLDLKSGRRVPRVNPQIQREAWRLLAGLEHLSAVERGKLGDVLLDRLEKDAANASYLWAIGRLGARTPAHGPVTAVIPPDRAESWIERLLGLKTMTADTASAVAQIGGRSDDPLRDIGDAARARAVAALTEAGFAHDADRLREFQPPAARDALQLFGESLPVGLRIRG